MHILLNICLSNLVNKALGLNLGKKLSNLLSNREALNQKPCIAMQCNDLCLY